jgi:prophage lp2 protein 3
MQITNKSVSPLRYPGGKTKLAPFLSHTILINQIKNPIFCEPFAGGAGLSLKLLLEGKIERIILNDVDQGIYSFWYAVFFDMQRLIDKITEIEVSLEERERCKKVLFECSNSGKTSGYNFDLGFATFFLNRVNVSGIIKGGAIGGIKQEGKFKIDSRFGKTGLIAKILKLAEFRDKVRLFNLDVIEFINSVLLCDDAVGRKDDLFIFLDPPYFRQGKTLYSEFYRTEDHFCLATIIKKKLSDFHWVLTYDNESFISDLYQNFNPKRFSLQYSANAKMTATELMFSSSKTKTESFGKIQLF